MSGPYGSTEILITAPDSAEEGDGVSLEITIKNVSNESINAVPGFLSIDGVSVPPFYIEDMWRLSPGQSHTWGRSFTMPDKSVLVHVESWWENSYALHKDMVTEKAIVLNLPPEFANFAIQSYDLVLT